MEEIARFLAAHPPFSQLPPQQVQQIAGLVRIEYCAAGTIVLTQGGTPSAFLYMVRRGAVNHLREHDGITETVDTQGEGEVFGYVSLIRGRPPIVTIKTIDEVLLYLIPAATFHQLRRDYPPFAQFFLKRISQRLDFALLHEISGSPAPELFQTHLRDLARCPVVAVSPQLTVREAAQLMREQRASSLVVDLPPYGSLGRNSGILTDRDLRNKVLAEGRPDSTPVVAVMTAPALTLPAESLVFEGLLLMQEHGINHLPVTDNGLIIGMVSFADILRRQSRNPILLPSRLENAASEGELRLYTDEVVKTVGSLLEVGARVRDIGRVVAVANDTLLVHILRAAERRLGPPPCPYAWLVLGSEGRYEQTLRTDQDNALIYADAPADGSGKEAVESYFTALAEEVVGKLVAAGVPHCPGKIMATNPQWRQPLSTWQAYFQRWIGVPSEEALLQVAIFFDYRQIYGQLNAEAALRPIIHQAIDSRVFLGRLARAALRQPAPLSFFQHLVLERKGEQRGLLDLKYRGTAMIVDLARLFALEAGAAETNTLGRLKAVAQHSSLSPSGAEELAAAFEVLGQLRLRWQYQQLQRGEQPTNQVQVDQLTSLERRELKEALRAVAGVQKGVEFTFQTSRLA